MLSRPTGRLEAAPTVIKWRDALRFPALHNVIGDGGGRFRNSLIDPGAVDEMGHGAGNDVDNQDLGQVEKQFLHGTLPGADTWVRPYVNI